MTTPGFAWVFNLDAEFELARPGYNTPSLLRDQLAEHGAGSRALMGPGDVLAEPNLAQPGSYVGRAWCPTPRALARLRAVGVEPEPHPSAGVLRQVNHRRFAFELGAGLPYQHYVESREALQTIVQSAPSRDWLLKRPLAFAGRGQQRLIGPIEAKQDAWIQASLRDDGLIIEPLVSPVLELSLHGFIWRDGRFELGHICEQRVSARGVFREVVRANLAALAQSETSALFEQAARVALALAAAGYFGPFGIDAYRYDSAFGSGFCALGEINARYTMAFAVGFPRPAHQLEL